MISPTIESGAWNSFRQAPLSFRQPPPNRPQSASTPITSRLNWPKRFGPASSAGNGHFSALSAARIIRLRADVAKPTPIPSLARLISETAASQRVGHCATEVKASVKLILEHAETGNLSQRQFAKRAGLSWGTWLRIRDGLADPVIWLPRLRSALLSLTQPTDPTPTDPTPTDHA